MMKNRTIENQVTKRMVILKLIQKISSWVDYRNSVVREYYNEEAMAMEESLKTLGELGKEKRGSRLIHS